MLTWLDGEPHWCLMLLCHQMAQMLAKPGSSGQLPINPNLVASKMSAVSTCGLLIWHSLQIFCIIYKLHVCFGVGFFLFFSLHLLWCWFKFKFKTLYCPLQSQQLNGNSSSLTPALPRKWWNNVVKLNIKKRWHTIWYCIFGLRLGPDPGCPVTVVGPRRAQ